MSAWSGFALGIIAGAIGFPSLTVIAVFVAFRWLGLHVCPGHAKEH